MMSQPKLITVEVADSGRIIVREAGGVVTRAAHDARPATVDETLRVVRERVVAELTELNRRAEATAQRTKLKLITTEEV